MPTTNTEDEHNFCEENVTPEMFEELKEFTFDKLPIFKKIVGRYGKKTVCDYAGHFLTVKPHPHLREL
ncbi:MAG: hypothetical protein WCJ84_03345 [Candidatus Peregrinibacteria bacterium]